MSTNRQALPKQQAALSCPAFELLYGGQKGGGKTEFLVFLIAKYVLLAHDRYLTTRKKQGRCRLILFRKNLHHLKDIIGRLKDVLPELDPAMGSNGWNKIEKQWTFTSGATLELAHLDGPDDHRAYHGQELTLVMFDQVEELSFDVFKFLVANVRSSDPFWRQHLAVRCTANPGGKEGRWVKDYFINPHPPGNKMIEQKIELWDGSSFTATRAFIPAGLRDNPYLPRDYEANLRMMPEHMQKMYLYGDWDAVEGAFFGSMIHMDKHYPQSFPIPGHWDVLMGIDWGSSAPAAVLWAARDEDGNIYVIDELYDKRQGKTGRMVGDAMAKRVKLQKWSNDRVWAVDDFYGMIDKQAGDHTGWTGASPLTGIRESGFRIFEANKGRIEGIEQIRERLLIRPNGKPRLYIFRDRCPNLCRTLVTVEVDPRDPEDYDITGETHAVDALRFILAHWPVETVKVRKEDAEVERWLDLIAKRHASERVSEDEYDMSTGYDS